MHLAVEGAQLDLLAVDCDLGLQMCVQVRVMFDVSSGAKTVMLSQIAVYQPLVTGVLAGSSSELLQAACLAGVSP